MFYLFGLSVTVFLFILILVKKGKSRADYILLSWIGLLMIHLALFNLEVNKVVYEYPHLLGVTLPLPILHGGFLYFYTQELIGKKSFLTWERAILHLIPFVLLAGIAIPFYTLSGSEKVVVYQNQGKGFEWYSNIQMMAFLIAGFSYSILVILEIRKYRRQAVNQFSNLDKKMLTWLEYLALGLGTIWAVSAFFNDQIVFGAVVVFVLFIGFFGINQFPVFYSLPTTYAQLHQPEIELPLVDESPPEAVSEETKYSKSRVKEDKASTVMTILEDEMKAAEPFRNPNLTLDELATRLKVSPNDLSQVINTVSGKTFYHYINTYRIEEFLRVASLPESKKFTYLGLAYRCGFNSKTTFNKYFKLHTGKTPSLFFGATAETSAETFAQK